MASFYGELVIDRENNTINGKPWPIMNHVRAPVSPPLVNFWELSEEAISEISQFPISWYLDSVKRLAEKLEEMEPRGLADFAGMLSIQAQFLRVRLMDDLTKDAPGRRRVRAESLAVIQPPSGR